MYVELQYRGLSQIIPTNLKVV